MSLAQGYTSLCKKQVMLEAEKQEQYSGKSVCNINKK